MNGSDTTSLRSSIYNYRVENGRTYHAYKEGEYWGPNDEEAQDNMDIGNHLYTLLLRGKLFKATIDKNPRRVLDVGTGTGIWAIDFADQYPSAEVIGVDLSPIQPSFVVRIILSGNGVKLTRRLATKLQIRSRRYLRKLDMEAWEF